MQKYKKMVTPLGNNCRNKGNFRLLTIILLFIIMGITHWWLSKDTPQNHVISRFGSPKPANDERQFMHQVQEVQVLSGFTLPRDYLQEALSEP